ncbi:NAD-dependent epimerase/dehydratase family protein [Algoriphagus kandeliae]|uniref:NAD-dependent epimerase/dehydratase family protein n=1 Tax=Algoriphagus kandeliae TaxID=2562278 RepID=A0A4Y9QNL6_9BACT|nr:NAD(P)H-binding protein [Algoriphagus kandeliae]TFV93448.1 NAD-dependent epimerase/dehydratase family protein [Algoriphagus kandeliae]
MTKISIIGLGWVGLPLAKKLIEKGYSVLGSTTSSEKAEKLQKEGVPAVHFSLNPYPTGTAFQQLFQADVLVLNIPPKSRTDGGENYLEQLKFLKDLISNSSIQKVLYVSSTGVYPNQTQEQEYLEDEILTSESAGNVALWKAEQYLKEKLTQKLTILRFGGLLGDDRIPGKYFAGKNQVVGHTRVNYIHREDAVRMMIHILKHELWNETFNGVAPLHPTRREIYEKNALELEIPLPESFAIPKEEENRIISSKKIMGTGFNYLYPDPLKFPYELGQ